MPVPLLRRLQPPSLPLWPHSCNRLPTWAELEARVPMHHIPSSPNVSSVFHACMLGCLLLLRCINKQREKGDVDTSVFASKPLHETGVNCIVGRLSGWHHEAATWFIQVKTTYVTVHAHTCTCCVRGLILQNLLHRIPVIAPTGKKCLSILSLDLAINQTKSPNNCIFMPCIDRIFHYYRTLVGFGCVLLPQ